MGTMKRNLAASLRAATSLDGATLAPPPFKVLAIGSINDGGKCTTWSPPHEMIVGVTPAKTRDEGRK